ncbi:thioredoxin domain-containing protein [Rhizobium sp. CRIBSB]|nr:thioredoxin domain-containing protein [Rhizobium sp. CRIBSB]
MRTVGALTIALAAALGLGALAAPASAQSTLSLVSDDTVAQLREDDRVVGAMDAPVTLTAYVSMTCTHCAAWHNTVLPTLTARYVDTGQVRIVYRDLPTPPREVAVDAAILARCVPAAKFDAVMDRLFRSQPQFRSDDTVEARQAKADQWLMSAGAVGGLNADQVRLCIDSDANQAALDARAAAARADGVNGTPWFFFNGQPANFDYRNLAAYDTVIQPLLAGQ